MIGTAMPSTPAERSVRTFVEQAAGQFAAADLYYGHGTDNPDDEAVYLVFAALGLDFDCDEAELDAPLDEADCRRLDELIHKRIHARIPTAYLVRQAWFCGLPFYVDERVLIPRSPIAELIHERFTPWLEPERIHRVLDIGTGSGCIAIACAYALPEAFVDGIDIDADALAVARQNILDHGLTGRVEAIESDLFTGLATKYDLIIANPPYVDAEDMTDLPAEYEHEPRAALAAGDDGLVLVRRLLSEVHDYLHADGILILEVGNSRAALEAAYPDLPFVWLDFASGGDGVALLHAGDLSNI